jgi:hypothetical protein
MGIQRFIPNAVQLPILKIAERQLREIGKIRIVIFKCRQPGISTLTSAIVWNRTALYNGVYSFIVAQDKTTVGNIFSMHEIFQAKMSGDIRPTLQYFNKGADMVLANSDATSPEELSLGSKLLVGEAKNINVGTGQTIHNLHLSEVCRYPSSDSLKDSLIPACSDSPGTVRIYESTAHFGGAVDWFKYQCERAQSGDKDLAYYFVEWWKLAEYAVALDKGEKVKLTADERYLVTKIGMSLENIKWRRAMIKHLQGDEDSFRLSYPIDYEEGWITRESSTFPHAELMEMQKDLRPPLKRFKILCERRGVTPVWRMYEDPEGEFWVWKLPEPNKVYDIGADVAEGMDDGDWSVAEVIHRVTNEQCAEYRAHCLPDDFGDILALIGNFYNTAQIAPEVNNSGLSTIKRLREVYANIYLWRKDDTLAPKLTGLMGFKTQYDSKQILVTLARGRIFRTEARIYSKVLWDELRFFHRDFTPTGMITYRAATGHDDCVMAWMIGLKASDDENFEKYRDVGSTPVARAPERMDNAGVDADWAGLLGSPNGNTMTGSWD